MKRAFATVAGILLSGSVLAPAAAHHVGGFTPKDTDITLNFKQIKTSAQAGRFDVAVKLFDNGILHDTMEKHEKSLPSGLEDGLRASLKAKDLPGAELRLTIFLAFLAKERVRDAMTKLRDAKLSPEQGREQARKILNAAWRYYNLADFVISMQNPKAAVALRMAFEDAQTFLGGMLVDPMWAASAKAKPAEPDDGKAVAVLTGMMETIQKVIAAGTVIAREGRARKFLPRP